MAKKQVKSQENKVVRFSWPDFILYEGRELHYCKKTPSFATYMLPGAYMNRSITLSKQQWLNHLSKN
jgi:hypothetical protein